jgi:ribulose-5-phosphate 4-epimerase/fuculose-1-phosphate aldolase
LRARDRPISTTRRSSFALAGDGVVNQYGGEGRAIIDTTRDLMGRDAAEWQARVDLAAAHRLAVHFGYHEGIDNHFTVLVPGHADRFLLAPFGLHWSEIRARDFLVVDFAGNVLSGAGPVEDTAFHIHAPLHAARPDVACVLHTHMPYATALSMLEAPDLLMASQNAIGFAGLVACCDYAGFALDSSEGRRMAAALGDKAVLLLRNHGVVVTGASIADAFNSLYFFERAAMTQILAQSSGHKIRLVPEPELSRTVAQYATSAQVEGLDRIDLHFSALKRMLDRQGADYAA